MLHSVHALHRRHGTSELGDPRRGGSERQLRPRVATGHRVGGRIGHTLPSLKRRLFLLLLRTLRQECYLTYTFGSVLDDLGISKNPDLVAIGLV